MDTLPNEEVIRVLNLREKGWTGVGVLTADGGALKEFSSEGFCGVSTLHCGDHCQSAYSGKNACYGDRFQRKCVSGYYDFSATTWVINADAYNGNPDTADFLAEPRGLQAGNIRFGQYGGVMLSLSPQPNSPSGAWQQDSDGHYPAALGARLSTTSYMLYGTFKSRFISSGIGGIVTAFISYSDVKDEIDWEITGKDVDQGQSNFFYRGVVDYTKSKGHGTNTDTSNTYHDYEVRWAEDSITWLIDGQEVRKVTKSSQCNSSGECTFPSTPSKIEIAIWDGGANGEGTRNWAGGYVPWSQTDSRGFNATYQSITVQCAGDPVPTGPPKRPSGYSAPSLREPVINVAVPGVSGYDENKMKSTGSAFTQNQKAGSGGGKSNDALKMAKSVGSSVLVAGGIGVLGAFL
ncbi:hypothetical protein HDU97_009990 [Phlyctochytrium planicorne]|nr:hypothetical protein HDU97_009990 [Phlyctochytrium planicorne]